MSASEMPMINPHRLTVAPISLNRPNGDRATVLLHGAHVTAWRAGGRERLYLSPISPLGGDAAIRGGIPVVFPQFNQRGPDTSLPKHGFARNRLWTLVESSAAQARLRLTDDAASLAIWPHHFILELTVTLGDDRLDVELAVQNRGADPWAFTSALHTYLAVGDIMAAQVDGLAGVAVTDTVEPRDFIAGTAPLTFATETDRIYWQAGEPIGLTAPSGALAISMRGFEDAVIWNPWSGRAAQLDDLPDDDWRQMLCIEAARIGRPVTLAPGERWVGAQTLQALGPTGT